MKKVILAALFLFSQPLAWAAEKEMMLIRIAQKQFDAMHTRLDANREPELELVQSSANEWRQDEIRLKKEKNGRIHAKQIKGRKLHQYWATSCHGVGQDSNGIEIKRVIFSSKKPITDILEIRDDGVVSAYTRFKGSLMQFRFVKEAPKSLHRQAAFLVRAFMRAAKI